VIPYNALILEFANFETPCTFVIENLKLSYSKKYEKCSNSHRYSFLDVILEFFFY
jgi:hypothetical protein